MPTRSAQTAPTPVDAANAALDAYNLANQQLNEAAKKLDEIGGRPPDDAQGHDTGGKEWDKNYAALATAVQDAKGQAATVSRQYATILQQQAAQSAKDTSPEGVARTDALKAQAEVAHAKADGYAATTETARLAAQARLTAAQAALDKAQKPANVQTYTAPDGLYTKDNPLPDGTMGWRKATDQSGNALPGSAGKAVATNTTDQFITSRNPDGSLKQEPNPNYKAPLPTTVATNTTDQYIVSRNADGTTSQVPNPNFKNTPTAVATNTTDQYITSRDANGNLRQDPNPNYVPLPKYGPATPTSGPMQDVTDPKTGVQTFQPNPNAPVEDVGAKVQQLSQQATAKRDALQQQVQSGAITQADALQQFSDFWNTTVEPAKQSIAAAQRVQQQQSFTDQTAARTSQNQSDATTTSAASDLATYQQNAATTGSNLLQKRADLAQTSANNVLSIGTGSKNFGIGGGAVPDVSNLFNAASQNATQQLGGQSTMDAATRMVQGIDPNNSTGFAAHAAAALSQVLDRAQQQKPLQPPGAPTTPDALNQTAYSGAFAPGAQSTPSAGGPTTTIAPDGTVTINHTPSVPDYAMGSISDPSRAMPAIPVAQPLGAM